MAIIINTLRNNIYLLGKKFAGSEYGQNLKVLRQNQFLSAEDNQRIQNRLLSKLLANTYQQVPYYRNRFGENGLIKTDGTINLKAFTALTPITKEEIRNNYDTLMSIDVSERRRIIRLPTGGTTGNAIAPYADLQYWDCCLAQTQLFFEWMGLKQGMPYFYFWGAPQDLGKQSYNLKSKLWIQWLQNRYVLNCRRLSDDIMEGFVREINRLPKYQHIVACVSELYDFACFIQDHQLRIKRPFQAISVTTGALTDEMRETIESVFHCPVYSRYGCREAGDIACECQYQNGLHINPLYSYIEIVDGHHQPVPPGEEGRVLITNLHNELMPLIRYDIQDLAIQKEPGICRCGRSWNTFAQITGRIHERLILPDGSTFGKVFLHFIMEVFSEIRCYQLHQISNDTVEIHITASTPDYLETHPEELAVSEARFKQCTNNMMRIIYKQVPALEKAPSGKQLLILNKMKAPVNELQPLLSPVSPYTS